MKGGIIHIICRLIDDFGLTHDHESVACAYGKEKLDRTDMGAALDKSRRLILHWYVNSSSRNLTYVVQVPKSGVLPSIWLAAQTLL